MVAKLDRYQTFFLSLSCEGYDEKLSLRLKNGVKKGLFPLTTDEVA